MSFAVCTLFEVDYHYGVAALTNSLYRHGYRGPVYAGYRGILPKWCANAEDNNDLGWKGARTLNVANGIEIHFLPLDTPYHFTNYKPDFLLQLLETVSKKADRIFYFDPDIVIMAPWPFFLEWVNYGLALCEDVNSPLDEYHPRRAAWRNYFGEKNVSLQFKNPVYVNGGFIGVSTKNRDFLSIWKTVQELMAPAVGGLNCAAINGGAEVLLAARGPFSPFGKTDQDALNASLEAWDGAVSFLGKEGMAFKSGASAMAHALGQPKPWKKNFIASAFEGRIVTTPDKIFWLNINAPIKPYRDSYVKYKKACILITAFVGRFYRRY